MNRIDAFIDYVNSRLRCFHRADRQRDQQADPHGPQPVVRLLDESEDIAQVYSSSGAGNFKRGDLANLRNPAPENKRKSAVLRVLDSDHAIDFECETIHQTEYAVIYCDGPAVGVCKHCLGFVCEKCLKEEFCYAHGTHQVSLS